MVDNASVLSYILTMITFEWNTEKNEVLFRTRGITFDEIINALERGCHFENCDHPNPDRYPNQKILTVEIDNYVYLVPYVIDAVHEVIFLKTIIPSRKATKKRKQGGDL